MNDALFDSLATLPVIGILRGLEPDQAVPAGQLLFDAGFTVIEVPVKGRNALATIRLLSENFSDRMMIGVGTVTRPEEVLQSRKAGATFAVSPNTDVRIIAECLRNGIAPIPGFTTVTEAFTAIEAGAQLLKLFPAGVFGPAYIHSLNSVLAEDVAVCAVGAVTASNAAEFLAAGCRAVGIGSELYHPVRPISELSARAEAIVAAVRR